jgi:prepilin-type N-terminal cleavage/methylation domain-containing protein
MTHCERRPKRKLTPTATGRIRPHRGGFTLIELLVVIIIVAILTAMTLGALATARTSSRTQTTSLLIRALNDAIMSHYELYEDLALSEGDLVELRKRMREELPDAWADVADVQPPHGVSPALNITSPKWPMSKSYAAYKHARQSASATHQSAECLYMIITHSGAFPDFLENVRPERVGDVDGDGAKEFVDGWGNPIAFIRWAPGFSTSQDNSTRYSPIQIADPDKFHDPIDTAMADNTAFALYPLIYSTGPDAAYGLLEAKTGWPNVKLGTTSPNTPCTFNPSGDGLVGAPNPAPSKSNDYRDNITNHALLAQ